MPGVNTIVGGVLFFTGLVCVALSVPLIQGRVPMNRYYGVRFNDAFASAAIWQAANRFGGWALVVAALPLFALALISPWLPLERSRALLLACLMAPAVTAVGAAAITYRYVRRLASTDLDHTRGRGERPSL